MPARNGVVAKQERGRLQNGYERGQHPPTHPIIGDPVRRLHTLVPCALTLVSASSYITYRLYNRTDMPNLDIAFSALADPTRRAILARLALGEATVMELAAPFDMTQPAVSRHLKVLEGAGLILRRAEGTRRPCRLAPQAISEIDQWLGMLRQALSKNYDRLDDVLAGMSSRAKKKRKR